MRRISECYCEISFYRLLYDHHVTEIQSQLLEKDESQDSLRCESYESRYIALEKPERAQFSSVCDDV